MSSYIKLFDLFYIYRAAVVQSLTDKNSKEMNEVTLMYTAFKLIERKFSAGMLNLF